MYPHQVERLTGVLDQAGLAALVAATPANVRYVTGSRSLLEAVFRTPQFAVFTRRGSALVVPAGDVPRVLLDAVPVDHVVCFGALALAWPDPPAPGFERLRALLDARAAHPVEALIRALDALEAPRDPIGVDEAGLPPPLWATLAGELTPRVVVPAAEYFRDARRVKAPYELECLERALHVAEEALNAVIQVLKPGMTERQAVALYEAEVLQRGAETYPAVVAFGASSAVPAPWPTDRALRWGDLARFDLGCVFKGYYARVARTAVMGAPDQRQQSAAEAIDAALEAAVLTIRPGVPAGGIYQAALAAAESGPLSVRPLDVGHGIGLEPLESPSLDPEDPTPLEAGEVLTVDVPCYAPGWAAVHLRDTVLVTTRASHVLNRSVRGLVVLE